MKKIWFFTVLPLLSACAGDMSFFSSTKVNLDFKMLVTDSFERDRVTVGSDFHWRHLLKDNGSPVEEQDSDCTRDVCARTLGSEQNFGPVSDGDRALLFYGRQGPSTHTVYLASKSFDLSDYATVEFSFDSLPFDLGDKKEGNAFFDEYIRLEICAGTAEQCGLAPIDSSRLDSDRWVEVWQHDESRNNNGLDGTNHSVDDWVNSVVSLNLKEFAEKHGAFQKKEFVFRFSSRLQDGFQNDRMDRPIQDAAGLDNVQVRAFR